MSSRIWICEVVCICVTLTGNHHSGSVSKRDTFSSNHFDLYRIIVLCTLYTPHTPHTPTHLTLPTHTHTQLQCTPGQTVQQVIETGIPEFSSTSYQVYQFPSRALLNPEKDASVLQDQEISIEPMRSSSPGKREVIKGAIVLRVVT